MFLRSADEGTLVTIHLSLSVQMIKPKVTKAKLAHSCCCCGLVPQSRLSPCDPPDCSPPGSSIHGISQARTLWWVAISFLRGSSQPRDRAHVSCTAGRVFTAEPPGKPLLTNNAKAEIQTQGQCRPPGSGFHCEWKF